MEEVAFDFGSGERGEALQGSVGGLRWPIWRRKANCGIFWIRIFPHRFCCGGFDRSLKDSRGSVVGLLLLELEMVEFLRCVGTLLGGCLPRARESSS